MPVEKISRSEISVGMAIPWAICDARGTLLLQKGAIITSEKQLSSLLEKGIYKLLTRNTSHSHNRVVTDTFVDPASPFLLFQEFQEQLSRLFSMIVLQQDDADHRLKKFSREFTAFVQSHPDAALGCVHLCQQNPYTLCHPLHVAILCILIATRQAYSSARIHSLVAAALTSNLSILELQEILQYQKDPLSRDQIDDIHEHPKQSAQMLRDAGISDPLCITLVEQHHEKSDGTGYPCNLAGRSILQESHIINLADRYSAMTSTRSYRKALSSREALRQFFMKKNLEYDETLVLSFIKELGIFPPGTFVKLHNGEISVVIKRGDHTMWPRVSTIIGSNGVPFAQPLQRDCNEGNYSIEDIHYPDKIPRLNLNMVWGYA